MRSFDNFIDAYNNIPQIYKVIGELNAYASHHLHTGNYAEAIRYADKVLSIEPENRLAKSYRDAAREKLYGSAPSNDTAGSESTGISDNRPVSSRYQGPVSVSKSDEEYMMRVNRENWEREQRAKERRKKSLKNSQEVNPAAISGNRHRAPLFCIACGKQLPADSVFCIFCGQRISGQ